MQLHSFSLIANRYEITAQLSCTALGVFFYAHDWLAESPTDTSTQLILMAVEPTLSAIPEFDAVLNRVLEKFRQPDSVLKVTDLRIEQGIYWLVIDEAEGKPLHAHCHRADPAAVENNLQGCLKHILKAAKAIVPNSGFGFLEPSAIWCSSKNNFKLLNAPLAITANILSLAQQKKVTSAATLTFHSAYISPQVAQGLPATPQDDTFSIAAIAYQFLGQQPAFGELDTLQAYAQQASPRPLQQVSADTWGVLKRALALQRHLRQPSPYELLHVFTVIPSDTPTNSVTAQAALPKRLFAGIAATLGIAVSAYLLLSSTNQQQHTDKQQITTPVSVVNTTIASVAAPTTNTVTPKIAAETDTNATPATHPPLPTKPAITTSSATQNAQAPVQRRKQPVASNHQAVVSPPRRRGATLPSTETIANVVEKPAPQGQPAAVPQAPLPMANPPRVQVPQAPQPRVAVSPPVAPLPAPRAIVIQQDATTFIVAAPPSQNAPTAINTSARQVRQTGDNTFVVQ